MEINADEIQDQLVSDPFNNELRIKFAEILSKQQKWEQALHQYDLLISQKINISKVFIGAAICLKNIERLNEAIQYYLKAQNTNDFVPVDELEKLLQENRSQRTRFKVLKGQKIDANTVELITEIPEKIRFSDIAGMEALKNTLRLQIIEPFQRPSLFAKFKKKAGGGIMLYGPPGCGKTMIARAVANECRAYFMCIGISDVLNMWIGESEKNLSEFFEKARYHKPTVLFFDELDALAFSRSKAQSENTRTVVNEFLTQLDGVNNRNDQLLILAATNMPWDVDPAMKRPGRFDKQIFVSPPDELAREELFNNKLKNIPCDLVDCRMLAKATQNFSGADIDGIIEATKETVLIDIVESGIERNITQKDLINVIKDYHPSTLNWLKTVRNIVKYAGSDDTYRDVERYLKKVKLF